MVRVPEGAINAIGELGSAAKGSLSKLLSEAEQVQGNPAFMSVPGLRDEVKTALAGIVTGLGPSPARVALTDANKDILNAVGVIDTRGSTPAALLDFSHELEETWGGTGNQVRVMQDIALSHVRKGLERQEGAGILPDRFKPALANLKAREQALQLLDAHGSQSDAVGMRHEILAKAIAAHPFDSDKASMVYRSHIGRRLPETNWEPTLAEQSFLKANPNAQLGALWSDADTRAYSGVSRRTQFTDVSLSTGGKSLSAWLFDPEAYVANGGRDGYFRWRPERV
jgi:hypothetical protein